MDIPILSPRELDLVRLLVAAHTDKEIAREMGITARTVTAHMEHIRMKIHARNRVAVAVWAVRQGVV